MFNWEKIWSDIKKNIFIVIIAIIIMACLIVFLSLLLQDAIDVPLPYFEK